MLNNLLQIHLKLKNVSKISPKNASETVARDEGNIGFYREIQKKRYKSPEKMRKIIDKLRLIMEF